MSIYKPFTTSDIVLSPFEVNKSFTFQGAAAVTGSGIDRFIGKNINPTLWVSGSNPTGQISTQDKFLVYRSIRELYYSNFLEDKNGSPANTASFNIDGTITGLAYTPNYYNYLPNTLNANRFFPTGSNDEIGIISIPSNIFGENIKPGTLVYETEGISYTDDGEGGLISASLKVGDIIYEHGITTLTSASNNINSFSTGSNITCSFESTITLYESQYKCNIRENEFNFSQNPTIISGSSNSGQVLEFATGSHFTPYVTTVGLYNNSKELIAVGKLAQPLPLSSTTDTNIIINLDL
tara:strand:+ start:1266 stop:2150 length:885 start_codon:yes stop_codon:yes gene_type:complete